MLIQEVNPPVVIHAAPWEHYFPQNVYDYIYNMTLEIADEDYDLRRCFRKGEDWKQVLPTFFDDLVETVIEDYVITSICRTRHNRCPPKSEDE